MTPFRSPLWFSACAVIFAAEPALATPPPLNESVSASGSNGSASFQQSQTAQSGEIHAAGTIGHITAAATSRPSTPAVAASSSVHDPGGATAQARLQYDFEVVSNGAFTGLAPVEISGRLRATASGGGVFAGFTDNKADLLIAPEAGGPAYVHRRVWCMEEDTCDNGFGHHSHTLSFSTVALIPIGDLTRVTMTATAVSANVGEPGFEHSFYGGSALVDPIFAIDAVFLDAHPGLSLEFSPGVGNGGIPEPSAWALMLTGFFALGAGLRRHRRLAAAS